MGCKHSQEVNRTPKNGEETNVNKQQIVGHHQQFEQNDTKSLSNQQCRFGNVPPMSTEEVCTKEKSGLACRQRSTSTSGWVDNALKECHHQQQENNDSMDTTTFIHIDRIPPEVWDLVFGNLHDFRDCVSAYNVCVHWKNVLYSTKSSWLFSMVFPMLLEHLSKSDILQCRLVSRRWCFGVDHFLENCAFHRPALEPLRRALSGKVDKFHHTDMRLQYLEITLRKKQLAYLNLYDADKMNKLLAEAVDHPRCPFIGRSADMLESHTLPMQPPNLSFLQAFGHHLHHIQLVIENYPPSESLTRLLAMISALSNIKKLKLICIIVSSSSGLAATDQSCPLVVHESLPKLETLDLIILPTRHVRIVDELLYMFGNESLQTLSTNVIPVAPNWRYMANLSYLTISLDSDIRISSLLSLKSSLQRLSLRLHGRVSPSLLFKVVRHFQSSLHNFTLSLCPDFFGDLSQPTSQNTTLSEQLAPFSMLTTLNGFPQVKRTMISTWRPISLNYICGLHKSLEYLHISLKGMEEWEQFLPEEFSKNRCNDKLDLLECSKKLTTLNRLEMYKSNVWEMLPRLRVLTMQISSIEEHRNGGEWEYRREIYDKIHFNEIIKFKNKLL